MMKDARDILATAMKRKLQEEPMIGRKEDGQC